MNTLSEVRHLHLELSSKCNARCPRCPRNFNGFPIDRGSEETNISLSHFKEIVSVDFLQQIEEILINGNYGDFVMNHDSVDIIRYIKQANPTVEIQVSTNGSARDKQFWQDLGQLGISIWFCIDGLEDTHSLYRQDTNFNTIIQNAQAFIKAGGHAVWCYTQFEHNQHQTNQARELSKQLGFQNFYVRINDRKDGPVYNRAGHKIFNIGKTNPDNFPDVVNIDFIKSRLVKFKKSSYDVSINCEAKNQKSMYIGSTGKVVPCCYFDLAKPGRPQDNLFYKDSELEDLLEGEDQPIAKSRPWFPKVIKSWESADTQHGICQAICGKKL